MIRAKEVLSHFQFEGVVISIEIYGNGHINDTYLAVVRAEDGKQQPLILQKMNRKVLKNPVKVMENIQHVTEYLKGRITENGGDSLRETLNVIPAENGKAYYMDGDGEYWRVFIFVKDTFCYEQADSPEIFKASGMAFGNFQRLLADFPAGILHETIEGFHDTRARFARFKQVAAEDICGRAVSVQEEIQFVLDHEHVANLFGRMVDAGEIPLRVTHNDTKLNNVLMDKFTGKGICIIDLDTVMPGLAMNDFGDSIRFGASTAPEDEQDLDKVSCDMGLFEAYTEGFITGCGGRLTQKEIELLPAGAVVMTFECGMRFLTDYLEGDVYFKIHREKQNLDRCRTQFKLVTDMEQKWDTMCAIVKKYS